MTCLLAEEDAAFTSPNCRQAARLVSCVRHFCPLGFIEPPCHRLMPVRGHGQCVKFLEMAPPTPRRPSPLAAALISELAGFYSFLQEFFRADNGRPCLQPLAMATVVAVSVQYTHTHTGMFCLWAHCQSAQSRPEGVRRLSLLSASGDLTIGSSSRCGVTRGVKAKTKTEIAGQRHCVVLSRHPSDYSPF